MTRSGLAQRDVTLNNLGEDLEQARLYRSHPVRAYQEGFQEFIQDAIPVTVLGKKYRVHPNVNFYIDMTSSCPCDCPFCIAKVSFERQELNSLLPKQFYDAVSGPLRTLLSNGMSVQVTGGEPTTHPDTLIRLLDLIGVLRFTSSALNTNGFGLSRYMVNRIEESRLTYLDISRHHYNDNVNAEIMGCNPVSSAMLSQALRPLWYRTRLQCNLIGGYIDTYGEVMQFIAYAYHRLHLRNIAFAELTPLPRESFYQPEIVEYVSEKPVNVDEILERIERDPRFVFEKYRGGVACYYEIWKYLAYEDPVTVMFKYSDNHWLEMADLQPDLLPDIVMHTDGTVCGSWCRDRKVIWSPCR